MYIRKTILANFILAIFMERLCMLKFSCLIQKVKQVHMVIIGAYVCSNGIFGTILTGNNVISARRQSAP